MVFRSGDKLTFYAYNKGQLSWTAGEKRQQVIATVQWRSYMSYKWWLV